MSNITLDEWGPLLSREAAARRGTLLAIFTFIALLLFDEIDERKLAGIVINDQPS